MSTKMFENEINQFRKDMCDRKITTTFLNILKDNKSNKGFTSGVWKEHEGDAYLYAPLFFINYGRSIDDQEIYRAGIKTLETIFNTIKESNKNVFKFILRLQDIICGSFALVTIEESINKADKLDTIKLTLKRLEFILGKINFNLANISFLRGVNFYGSTTIAANIATLFTLFSLSEKDEYSDKAIQVSLKILEKINESAWDEELKAYRISPKRVGLYLYPNVAMITLFCNLYNKTKNPEYFAKAKELFGRIHELKSSMGFYYSPYSAKYNRAKTKEYATLSSQNYLLLAIRMLYGIERKTEYKDSAIEIFNFINNYLYKDGKIWHHWIDGRIAEKGRDREYFCRGCNLQYLYVYWLWKYDLCTS